MVRMHRAVLLTAALSGTPLLSTGFAFAAPPESAPAASAAARSTAPGEPAPVQIVSRMEQPNVPPTPMPMSLPDPARASEIKDEYGFGIFTLIAWAVTIGAVVLGLVYIAMRKSWSGAH
jgi:hypothetical protein